MQKRSVPANVRSGVVLLVVISLLVLFSLVGLAFVVYAESQANIARLWRERETAQQPGMDPELLLSYFLGQLIYDTDNPHSALRGHSLARTMYGQRANQASLLTGVGVTPFNGLGRLQSKMNQAAIDYTNYSGGAPNNPDNDGGLNPPYTYPDLNNMFLGAVRAADGAVLIPSFMRNGVSLRPSQAYHAATGFPGPDDPQNQCDVKNLADSPGFGTGTCDSIWIDCGYPVMTGPDGRKFKALFAPLIMDLDNRVNANFHGNNLARGFGNGGSTVCQSHQGWSVGEVNIAYVLNGPSFEARNIFDGTGTGPTRVEGRYDPGAGKWCSGGYWVEDRLAPAGHSYNMTNLDCNLFDSVKLVMPNKGTGFSIPTCQGTYGNGWVSPGLDQQNHPMLFNFFDPSQNVYHKGGVLSPLSDRRFSVRNMDAILRYGDAGSPALTSELFLLCPQSLATAKNRRQLTTHSFDVSRPGIMPFVFAQGGPSAYQLQAGNPSYPRVQAQVFNLPANSPNTGEYGPDWGAVSPLTPTRVLRGRLDLNRGFPTDYPAIGGNRQFAQADIGTKFKGAMAERRQYTQEVFDRLRELTGAADPATATPDTPEYDALRWLAQLAVNITDFINYQNKNQTDCSDIMTSFNWNPQYPANVKNGWVFGTNIPKLVINEAYIQLDSSPTQKTQDVNCFVELHNPIIDQASNERNISFTETGNARLFTGQNQGYAPYRLIIAQTRDAANPGSDNTQELRKANNVLGTPVNVQTVVDDYSKSDAPALMPNGTQTLVATGDNLFIVKPPTGKTGTPGSNIGYYVLGSHKAFPGTETAAQCFVTLPLKDDQDRPNATRPEDFPGKKCSMHYTLQPQAQAPAHTICLQRLACPYLPPQPDPAQEQALGYFNPYITVDYMLEVPTTDNSGIAGAAKNSVGRNQPYAADKNHQIQQGGQEQGTQPKHTFFSMNTQFMQGNTPKNDAFPFDWLLWGNRPSTSQFDLLHVSGYKPSELTQMFMTGAPDPATGKPQPANRFQHRAPWFDSSALIYRFLEYCEGGLRPQFTPLGGRFPGKVNINTVWDLETFQAVCDAKGINWFTAQGVQNAYTKMIASRTPGGVPGANDRPFRGLATPFASAGGQFGANGSGIDDTILRADPTYNDLANFPDKRLLEPDPNLSRGELRTQANAEGDPLRPHPFCRYEMLTKTGNTWTTRSNVFAVLVTVGFFEVMDDSNPAVPPKLGPEIGRAQNRHKRHRMMAIIDRTNVTVAVNASGALPQVLPGQVGQRPMFIPSLSPAQPGNATVAVNVLGGAYEEIQWNIKQGTKLLIDVGPDQEVVSVTNVGAGTISFTCTKPHAVGFMISTTPQAPAGLLAVPGNPGPQPRFEVRNPAYDGVVRYFSIIE